MVFARISVKKLINTGALLGALRTVDLPGIVYMFSSITLSFGTPTLDFFV